MNVHRAVPAAVLAAALLTLTACSAGASAPAPPRSAPPRSATEAPTGDELLGQARAAMAAAGSYRVDGDLVDGGMSMTVSMAVDSRKDCVGTMSRGAAGTTELRRTATTGWYRPDDTYWDHLLAAEGVPADAASVTAPLRGRFIGGAAGGGPAGLERFDVCGILAGLPTSAALTGKAAKAAPTVMSGKLTVPLTVTEPDGSTAELYVAAEGKPYPVELRHEKDHLHLTFAGYGEPVTVQAPPADQVIAFADLMKALGG